MNAITPIVAGRFEQQDQAEAALAALRDAGFGPAAMACFYVNPRGQHALTPIGGDTDDSRDAHQAPKGAGVGTALGGVFGVALGAAALPVAAPVAVVAGAAVAAGVGAYAGSLIGALNQLGEPVSADHEAAGAKSREEEAPPRHAGMLVAVAVPTADARDAVVEVLKACGARDIEQGEGQIAGGDWVDFDPQKPLRLIGAAAPGLGAAG